MTLLGHGARILTHCNAGWLAVQDWGTALAPVYRAARAGLAPFVIVSETRPRLQGARLTTWELRQEGVAHVLIADSAAPHLIQRGQVDLVLTGADRIAAETERVLRAAGPRCTVFNLGHGIWPGTPIEGVEAMLRTAREVGERICAEQGSAP